MSKPESHAGPSGSSVTTLTSEQLAALAQEHGLEPVGVRPSLGAYLATMWQRRHFAFRLASSKAYARNQGSYLGQVWAILNPVLWATVYFMVFGLILKTDRGIDNFVGFLVAGVFMFHFVSACISNGAKAITSNQGVITALQFPRALLPVATVLSELFTLLPALLVLLLIVPATDEPLSPAMLLMPVAVLLAWLFGTGIAFICARLVVQFRDVQQLIPFVLRAAMYMSGVFFSIEHYAGDSAFAPLLENQPIAVFLRLVRSTLLEGVPMTPSTWLWAVGWALGTLVIGFIFFWQAEESYGRG
ncbi:ABC transporter permease [Nocardioides sp. AE5]|uniref:ABC transporter permease n=1 Tax=Nocardioides sp. AE5 TaxID=2962573 RepID=UPI0028819F3B|nr:ABC transporter permease [Nocardioides sp. AE5]MDT0203795.1 ABC transporter permease [Nocardioides sp. AE5]